MTSLLQTAFERLSKLPDAEQDLLAVAILTEVEHMDARWDESFASSRGALAKLVAEAKRDVREGRATPLDFDHR